MTVHTNTIRICNCELECSRILTASFIKILIPVHVLLLLFYLLRWTHEDQRNICDLIWFFLVHIHQGPTVSIGSGNTPLPDQSWPVQGGGGGGGHICNISSLLINTWRVSILEVALALSFNIFWVSECQTLKSILPLLAYRLTQYQWSNPKRYR